MKLILPTAIVLLLGLNIYLPYQRWQQAQRVLGAQTERASQLQQLVRQKTYWEDLAEKYPSYRDSYVQLALINYYLEDVAQARVWVEKILEVDPNYVFGPEFPKELGGK